MDVKDCNISNDQSIVFKCDICPLTFRSSSARNLHILDHFEKMPCSICHQILVQLGDNWYGPHEHVGQSLIKSEANSDEANECRMEPIAIAFSSELSHEPSSTKSDDDSSCTEPTETCIGEIDSSVDTEIKLNSFSASEYTLENQTDSVGIPDTVEHKPIDFIDVPVDGEKSTHDLGSSEDDDKTENIETKVKTNRKRKQKCSKPKKKQKTVATTQDCWKCDVCNVEFPFEANLIEHKNVCHQEENAVSNEMPQDDNFDDTSSIDSNDRNTMNSKTSSTPKRGRRGVGGACGVCNKKFVCKSALKYHMNIHLGVKPFKCEDCGKAYIDKRQLTCHRKIHEQLDDSDLQNMVDLQIIHGVDTEKLKLTEEQLKSLTCPLCNKKCTGQFGLRGHMTAHKQTRYMCKLCQSSFNSIAKYRFHNESAHQTSQNVIVRALKDDEAIYWACEYCNTDFELEVRFARHLLKEHSEEKLDHLCYICSEKFNQPVDLLAHMRAHPESNQHKCTVDGCDYAFAYKAGLSVHLLKHKNVNGKIIRKTQIDLSEATKQLAMISENGPSETGEPHGKSLTCNICSMEFTSKTSLVSHINTHRVLDTSNQRMKCTVAGCDKIFKSYPGLYHHISVHHPEAIKECDICQKTFYTEAKLAEHRMKHDKTNNGQFACNICSKRFYQKFYLLSHLSQHEKEFVCNVCNEKFASARQLMAHRVKHGKKQTFTCRFADCNKTFDNRRELRSHTLEHPNREKKTSICPLCGKEVARSYLNDHLNVHNGITPYKCQHCDKEFARGSSLRRHLLIHANIKPYSCDIDGCNQTYRDKIDLNRHKFSVHKIYTKKHICSICSKVFPEKKLLTKHTINAHNKVQQT